jgi:Domain of unknown function (DUF4145)
MPVDTSIKYNDSHDEDLHITCSLCNNETRHEVVSSVDITEDVDGGEITAWTHYQIVQCLGCQSYSFRRSYACTEDIHVTPDGEQILDEAIEVYPPRVAGKQQLRNAYHLPRQVRRIYEETYKALCSEMPILAAVGIGALVEAVCKEQNAQGYRLHNQIDDLVKQGVLTNRDAEILHKLQFMDNKAAHEVKKHDVQTLSLAFEIAEHLLQGVYIFPEEVARLD